MGYIDFCKTKGKIQKRKLFDAHKKNILNESDLLYLPSCQAASLRQLEEENHEAAARLQDVVYRGDMLLEKIQGALADIAQSQLRTRNGVPSQPSPAES